MNTTLPYHWIDSDEQLRTICSQTQSASVVALDTEFIRVRSYYPKLGLIQLFDGNHIALIDPQQIQDFSPFVALLANPQVTKVLHACSEDLEVFQHYFQQLPTPMIDTQIMAAFTGHGISVGFAKLVSHYLGQKLDKGASRTDWLARPLSETQLQYACADVYYLLPVYQRLAETLSHTAWQEAVLQECQQLLAKPLQPVDSQKAYKNITNAWQLNPQQLAVLKILAKWRIEEAQKRDLALNFVVKEQSLFHIAKIQPKHTACLLEFMHPNEVRRYGKKLLWLVEQGQQVPPSDYPEAITRLVDDPAYKYNLKKMQKRLAEIQPQDLLPELLASKRQLTQLFQWYKKGQVSHAQPELLQGWRAEYGKQLLAELESV